MTPEPDTALVPAGQTTIPADPADLTRFLRARLEALVLAGRAARGEVTVPEDAWPLLRSVATVQEQLDQYSRAFREVSREARGYLLDELVDVVGEQDGIPVSGVEVPDDGDVIKIGRDIVRTFAVDMDALAKAAALLEVDDPTGPALEVIRSALDAHAATGNLTEDELTAEGQWMQGRFVEFAVAVVAAVLRTGKFEPQTTKVKAFTTHLGQRGMDDLAASVSSTVHRTDTFRGVTVKREHVK